LLTSDLLRVRRREGIVHAQYVSGEAKERLLPIARAYVALYARMVGRPREEIDEAARAIEVSARDRVAALGLRKVLDDRCEYEAPSGDDPEEMRREVFLAAAAAHRALDVRADFDRAAVLGEVGARLGKSAEELDAVLFADLRGAEILRQGWPLGAEGLIERYNVALAQSILLRATRVTLLVSGETADRYRRLFRAMRFLGLLHQVSLHAGEEPPAKAPDAGPAKKGKGAKGKGKKTPAADRAPAADGHAAVYSITIDGPFSLFGPSQKYGLRLATLLHAVLACERFFLAADVIWGPRREPAVFRVAPEDGLVPHAAELPSSSPVLDAFVAGFDKLGSPWKVAPSGRIFAVPGGPALVPDLVFTNERTGEEVFLEAFGFWSRAAVWARVEQIRRGALQVPLLLAVSKELRVSAEVLEEGDAGEVYVYKATMLPRAVLERLEKRDKRA
jgi:predicted nuclease of restriction endonuclease-like RecB superfamily